MSDMSYTVAFIIDLVGLPAGSIISSAFSTTKLSVRATVVFSCLPTVHADISW